MKFEVNISNKVFYALVVVVGLVLGGVAVYGYGTSNPAVMGHSTGELVLPSFSVTWAQVSAILPWRTGGSLELIRMDANREGGEIRLNSANPVYNQWVIDSFAPANPNPPLLRIFSSSTGVDRVQIHNSGAGTAELEVVGDILVDKIRIQLTPENTILCDEANRGLIFRFYDSTRATDRLKMCVRSSFCASPPYCFMNLDELNG